MGDDQTLDPDEWLREKEIIARFRLSHSTLNRRRKDKEIEVSKIGRAVYYSVKSIRAMFERNKR
jgi:hypothetical protein